MATQILSPKTSYGKDTTLKFIQEYFGSKSNDENMSLAIMHAMPNWIEPGQIAEFDEYIYVITGHLYCQTKSKMFSVESGQGIKIEKGEWVRFKTNNMSAMYVAVCIPAFKENLVKRDEE